MRKDRVQGFKGSRGQVSEKTTFQQAEDALKRGIDEMRDKYRGRQRKCTLSEPGGSCV